MKDPKEEHPVMTVKCWFVFFTLALATSQAQDGSRPAESNLPGSAYPRVHSDNRVTFRVSAPAAQKVQVVPGGKDNGLGAEPYDMVRDEKGAWTVTIPPVVPGFHYYWLLVDGFPANDPSTYTYFGWNKETSGIEVPDPTLDFYDVKDVPHGEVRSRWYFSKVTAAWRRAVVYTPPGYDANRKTRYPVLYLQHGAGENERGWTTQGRANFILDNLIVAGKARPMIAVMDSTQGRLELRPVGCEAERSFRGPRDPRPGPHDRCNLSHDSEQPQSRDRRAVDGCRAGASDRAQSP